jgi:hypothetical protein
LFGLFLAMEIFLTLLLALTLIFFVTGSQPAASRSIAPVSTVVSYILGSYGIWAIGEYMSYEWYATYGCLVENLFIGPLYSIVYLIGALNLLRYSLINNLKYFKQQYYSNVGGSVRLRPHIRLLNWLTSGIGLVTMCAIVIGLLWIFHLIYIIALKFDCKRYGQADPPVYFVFSLVVLAVTILIQIVDVLLNWRILIRCKFREYFIKNDPYFFRLERSPTWVLFILFIPSVTLNGISLIGVAFVGMLLFHYLLWMQVYFVTAATAINILRDLCRGKQKKSRANGFFDTVFEDEEVFNLLLEFSSNEWCVENPLIKRDIIVFKSLKTESERKELASRIITKFLSGSDSVMELNLSYQQREPCLKRFRDENYVGSDLFDAVEDAATQNLVDIWNRFRFSTEYKTHLQKLEAKNLMIEQE